MELEFSFSFNLIISLYTTNDYVLDTNYIILKPHTEKKEVDVIRKVILAMYKNEKYQIFFLQVRTA